MNALWNRRCGQPFSVLKCQTTKYASYLLSRRKKKRPVAAIGQSLPGSPPKPSHGEEEEEEEDPNHQVPDTAPTAILCPPSSLAASAAGRTDRPNGKWRIDQSNGRGPRRKGLARVYKYVYIVSKEVLQRRAAARPPAGRRS